VLIVTMIKLLAIWTTLSVIAGVIIAPALSGRLRKRGFPPKDMWEHSSARAGPAVLKSNPTRVPGAEPFDARATRPAAAIHRHRPSLGRPKRPASNASASKMPVAT
jgi:hypothetical protein